jgi:hypothetical protein
MPSEAESEGSCLVDRSRRVSGRAFKVATVFSMSAKTPTRIPKPWISFFADCFLPSESTLTCNSIGGKIFFHSEAKKRRLILTSRRLLNGPKIRASGDEGSARVGRVGGLTKFSALSGFVVREKELVKRAFNAGE